GEKLDVAGVENKFGVRPDQIVDYLMLVGDTVDNVPGVTKVGPKTAVKWLSEYGSIDALVQHAEDIKGVAGKNLRDAIPNFGLTRELITVRTDCDIDGLVDGLDGLVSNGPDNDELRDIYHEYGFRTWLRELTGDASSVPVQDARV